MEVGRSDFKIDIPTDSEGFYSNEAAVDAVVGWGHCAIRWRIAMSIVYVFKVKWVRNIVPIATILDKDAYDSHINRMLYI